MTCAEAERLVPAYLNNEIPQEKLEEFILHVKSCPSCYDELETYFTIYLAIQYLDDDKYSSYNMKKLLEEDLHRKEAGIRKRRRLHYCFGGTVLLSEMILLGIFFWVSAPEMLEDIWNWITMMPGV
ncbi:MAG: zf-HC2 domain-containing protein [Lachnospiraceae bacterium]|nr:zf-HC2 domain-containing protein [Lachnospiraceae bacterium]